MFLVEKSLYILTRLKLYISHTCVTVMFTRVMDIQFCFQFIFDVI